MPDSLASWDCRAADLISRRAERPARADDPDRMELPAEISAALWPPFPEKAATDRYIRAVARGSFLLMHPDQPHRDCRSSNGVLMPAVNLRASLILHALEEAEAELVGKAVVLTDGKAGTVVAVSLDELHGLRISIAGHDGKWPVSTIKFVQK
jgi:hypothetical protein